MSEANVEIIRRHCEIRDGKGGKRREVGMDDWSWQRPRPWIALVRRCRSVRWSASSSYVVAEQHDDGTLVLRPENASLETEAQARELAERHRETLDYLAEN